MADQRPAYYEGQTATNPQTGEQVIFRSGRWQRRDSATGAPSARETIENERSRANTLRRTANLGGEFLGHNRERGTGGPGSDSLVPTWNQPHRQAMESLTSQMVRANIQPGQAGTMNSNAEQEMVRAQYPNAQTFGDENARRVLNMYVDADLQDRRVAAMERWLADQRTLDGFADAWASGEAGLRSQIEASYRQRMNFPGAGSSQPGATNFQRDASGRIVPVR